MKNKDVVMNNQLIQSRYKLTKEEQNFIYKVVSQISKDDEDFKTYKVFFTEMEGLEKTVKHYKRFISFAESMVGKTLKITNSEEGKTFVCSWFSYIGNTQGQPFLEARFDPELKPYLIKLKGQFTKAKLPILLSFHSKYSSRLYFHLKSIYALANSRITLKKVVENIEVKSMVEQFGMPKSYLEKYTNFKNRFLIPTVEEINKKTEFEIIYKEHKTGRKITAIEFCIQEKEKTVEQLNKEILEIKTKDDYVPMGFNSKALDVLLDDELDLTIFDIKNIFDHYKTEDIEGICLELWDCWESTKIISKQGYFRGRIKQLNKKKTQNQDLSFGFDEI